MAISSQSSGIFLVIFALLLALLPVGTFGIVYFRYLDGLLGTIWRPEEITSSGRAFVGGFLAVLAVNLVVAGFVCVAYLEEDPPKKSTEDKKKD